MILDGQLPTRDYFPLGKNYQMVKSFATTRAFHANVWNSYIEAFNLSWRAAVFEKVSFGMRHTAWRNADEVNENRLSKEDRYSGSPKHSNTN